MPHRLLFLEANDLDYALIEAELRRSDLACEIKRATERVSFAREVSRFRPDVVISDSHTPDLSVTDVINILDQISADVPLVLLTEEKNEAAALQSLKHGAADYVVKERLPRLIACLRMQLDKLRLKRDNAQMQREREQFIRLTPDLFCLTDNEGTLQLINPAWTHSLGYAEVSLLGRPLFTLVHPDDRHALDSWWAHLVSGVNTHAPFSLVPGHGEVECRMAHQERGFRTIRWSARPFPAENKIYAYGHDVTERKGAEQSVRESEARFRRMADSAPVLIWMSDSAKNFIYFNRPWFEFSGRAHGQELGLGWIQGIHEQDRTRFERSYEGHFAQRNAFRVEFRLRRHDGQYRWVVCHGTPRYDENGTFSGYIGSCFDVTDQHEVEAHLAYRAIKQSALAGFGRYALAQHSFPDLSQEATRLVVETLGLDRAKILAIDAQTNTLRIVASSGPVLDAMDVEYGSVTPAALSDEVIIDYAEDQENFPGKAVFAMLGINAGLAVSIGGGQKPYGFLCGLSQDKRLFNRELVDFVQGIANILSTVYQRERAEAALQESEQKLLESQKMEAVGLLAGGVAHDFNNLLTAIRCYGDLLKEDLAEAAPSLQPKAEEILKATSRASVLVRQLLAFSRKQVLQPESLNMNSVIIELQDLVKSLLSENIELSFNLDERPVSLHADRSQLEQIIINLAINARDAMPKGGRLLMRTTTIEIPATENSELKPGVYCRLSVSDTGTGMSEEVQAKIFQPFFTTKPKGRGTGLGLATCMVVLKNYGGTLQFESKLGEGTTFHVLIPFEASHAVPLDLDFREEVDEEGSERILLVEDDETIRSVTSTILRAYGYEVFPFASGLDALEFCSAPMAPVFDLLLSDVVMPVMGGRDLAERLLAMRPNMRVLFMSGYVDDPIILQAMQDTVAPFLEKPFTRDSLAKKVRDALDSHHFEMSGR